MVIRVSTTCTTDDVEIGFFGNTNNVVVPRWSWNDFEIPRNSKHITLTKAEAWDPKLENYLNEMVKFSYKGRCSSGNITIHDIQLVKGPENCLTNRTYNYKF